MTSLHNVFIAWRPYRSNVALIMVAHRIPSEYTPTKRFSPNKCVHMLTVSVCTRNIDLKHAPNEFNGGRWPVCKKSLSCSHWGNAWKWQFFHTLRANSSACSAALWTKVPIPRSLLLASDSSVWKHEKASKSVFIRWYRTYTGKQLCHGLANCSTWGG